VSYEYGTYTYEDMEEEEEYDCGRYITKITDKMGVETDFTWTWNEEQEDSVALKIEVDAADGLRVSASRSSEGGQATVYATSGATTKKKTVLIPLVGDLTRVREHRYYEDSSEYDECLDYYDPDRCCDLGGSRCPKGRDMEYEYNDQGRITDMVCCMAPCGDGGMGTKTFDYDPSGLLLTKKTSPNGLETTYSYDSNDFLTKTTHPSYAAAGMRWAFDSYGRMTSSTTPNGETTTMAYDATGRVTSVTDPNSATTTMYYDDYGNMTRVTDVLSKDTYYYYQTGGCGGCGGSGGVLTKVKDALNNETEFRYDDNGRQTKVIDALDRETDYAYDLMGRVTLVTSPSGSGNTMTVTYDKLGRVVTKQGFGGETVTYEYNWLGQLTKTSDAVGDVESAYDEYGKLTKVTDSLDHDTTYAYDDEGQLTKVTDAAGKTTFYFYDAYGKKTKVGAGASGSIDPTEYFYSGTTGLLTKVTYTAGVNTYDAEYEYDGNARLTKLLDWIDAVDGLEYAYDAAGRLTQLTDYDGSTLDYAYDAAGRVTSMNDYFSHATTYTYTDTGQVSTITAPGSKVWTYAYNALSQPTSVAIPNGMTTAYGYDTDGTTLLHRYSYTYDGGDNLLTKAVYDGTNTVTTAFAYTDANEQTSMAVGGTTTDMAYDAWGRMTSKADGTYSAAYTYGPSGMLSTVTTDFPSESDATYQVGGDGKRRSRTVGGTETWYNRAGMSVINEENSNGTLSRTYFGHTAAHVDGTSPSTGDYRYYFPDHLGSVRHVRNHDKSSFAALEYEPYGGVYTSSGTTSSVTRRYAMLDWDDASRLHFAPFRYYGSAGGRWISRDPLGMIDGPNVYAYLRGDPVGTSDPLGLGPTTPERDKMFRNTFRRPRCVEYYPPNWDLANYNSSLDCANQIWSDTTTDYGYIFAGGGLLAIVWVPIGVGSGVGAGVDYLAAFMWGTHRHCKRREGGPIIPYGQEYQQSPFKDIRSAWSKISDFLDRVQLFPVKNWIAAGTDS
jgi:RHS repeat-associated protein